MRVTTVLQKQPPKVFSKNRCSSKFLKIYRKTPEPASLFFLKKKVAASNFIKKGILEQVFPCEFCEIFKNTFSTKYLLTTASGFIKLVKS